MKRSLAVLLMFVAASSLAQTPRGAVRILSIHSTALEGNLAGDPADQQFAVYLPAGYDSSASRYPVIYLLHGIGGSFEDWTKDFNIPPILDRLIDSKRIQPAIVVMPTARNRFLGSYYLNSPVTGRWADYIANEVVARVDHDFRTIAEASGRAIVGHSMGGFGAIHFAMTRPDVFSVAYAITPCCLDAVEDVGAGNVAAWMTALSLHSLDELAPLLEKGDFYPVALIGFLSATSPDVNAPLHVAFPYKRVRGELMPAHPAYDRWLEQFPVHAVARYRDNLLKLRAFGIEFGYDDQFAHIPPATAAFSRELNENRIPHRLDAYDGDHRSQMQQRLEMVIFPFVSDALAAAAGIHTPFSR